MASHAGNPTNTRDAAVRKFRRERIIGRYLANPTVVLLGRLGIRTTFATELETTDENPGHAGAFPFPPTSTTRARG
jgi:hypothetical protein